MKRPEGVGGGKRPEIPRKINETGTKEKSRSGRTGNVRQVKNKQGGRLRVVRRGSRLNTNLLLRAVTLEQLQTRQKETYRKAVTEFIRVAKGGNVQDCMNGPGKPGETGSRTDIQ